MHVFIRRTWTAVAFAALTVSSAACWESTAETDPEQAPLYADGVFSDSFDWDFHRTVTLDVGLGDSLRPLSGSARIEVRHTVYDNAVLFRGTLSELNAWSHSVAARVPQHEESLSVTVETTAGLVRQTVPIAEDGAARALFQ